jgi:hypothetical protein
MEAWRAAELAAEARKGEVRAKKHNEYHHHESVDRLVSIEYRKVSSSLFIIIIIISRDLTCVNRCTLVQTHGESKQETEEKVKGMKCSVVARQNTMSSRPASYTRSPG